MKLTEAMQKRKQLSQEIQELKNSLNSNIWVQDGLEFNEDPLVLRETILDKQNELNQLIKAINLTNSSTPFEGRTITEMVADRDYLTTLGKWYDQLITLAAENPGNDRYNRGGKAVKYKCAFKVEELRKLNADLVSKLQDLSNQLQKLNWETDLKDY